MERFKRTSLLLGEEAFLRLQGSFVVVCGLGAVGSYAAEALARSGVGRLRIVDFDKISPSNINRQLYALTDTVGRLKCDVAEERIHGINPACKIEKKPLFIHTDTLDEILEGEPDFVIDAIDSLNPKVELIAALQERDIAFISSMGAALKTDTTCIKIGPIKKVTYCPLASMLRKRLRRRNLSVDFPCVYSDERVSRHALASPDTENSVLRGNVQGRERNILGSLPTITGIFGLTASNYALTHLTAQL